MIVVVVRSIPNFKGFLSSSTTSTLSFLFASSSFLLEIINWVEGSVCGRLYVGDSGWVHIELRQQSDVSSPSNWSSIAVCIHDIN